MPAGRGEERRAAEEAEQGVLVGRAIRRREGGGESDAGRERERERGSAGGKEATGVAERLGG